jgi:hypothetical protein
MYLEILQQLYGASLEKQAMEKQALNPMQLVRMGRRFAGRGKMDRFNQLIKKRNAAVNQVTPSRYGKMSQLIEPVLMERDWLGHARGPVSRQYRTAVRRSPHGHSLDDLRDQSGYNHERFIKSLSAPYTAGATDPSELAELSAFLRQHNY